MIIRVAKKTDVGGIVKVHIEAFEGFLMTRLGERFLRTYYKIALDYEDVIALVACNETDEICGFVVGYYNPSSFYQYFAARKLRIAGSMVFALFKNPFLLRRVLASKDQAELAARDESYSKTIVELASVAVMPDSRGRGIGRNLVDSFISESAKKNAKRIVLTTDAINNESTNKFYVKSGFTVGKNFQTSTGRKMRQYIFQLEE